MDDQILNPVREKMVKALEILRADLQTIRTGRANPQIIENIVIPVYDGTQNLKLKELATITSTDARLLVVSPYDPSIISEIVKGLQEANLGFNPVSEGKLIRISFPPLTEERRQEFIKLAKAKTEGGRIMVRQVRHEAMTQLKRMSENSEIDEDTKKRLEKKVQELTDEMIAEIDILLERKEDLLKI